MLDLFATVMLVGASLVFAGAAWAGFSHVAYFIHSGLSLAANVILPSGLTIGTLAATRLRHAPRLSLALCILAVIPALYLAEWAVQGQLDAKWSSRPNYDSRSKIQVIRDLRKDGIDAYPVMRAKSLLVDGAGDDLRPILGDSLPALPLASLPNKTVVSCNETGQWLVYRSDAHGFHNPSGEWSKGPPAVMLVGDSFAHGSCVPSNANIAARLRNKFGPVLNLGVSGFGPLSMLAAIKEYGEIMKPKVVIWAFYEGNDLNDDLPFERRSPLLRRYLEDKTFSQELYRRRDAWTGKLKSYLDTRLEEAMARVDDPNDKLIDFLQLYHLREKFGLGALWLGAVPTDFGGQVAYFQSILTRSKELVESWGGRILFAYLPASERYFAASRYGGVRHYIHDTTLAQAAQLGFATVDLTKTFAALPDPTSLFVYPGSHYSAEGYRVAAEAIASKLSAAGTKR